MLPGANDVESEWYYEPRINNPRGKPRGLLILCLLFAASSKIDNILVSAMLWVYICFVPIAVVARLLVPRLRAEVLGFQIVYVTWFCVLIALLAYS